jgi:hypothetical protein
MASSFAAPAVSAGDKVKVSVTGYENAVVAITARQYDHALLAITTGTTIYGSDLLNILDIPKDQRPPRDKNCSFAVDRWFDLYNKYKWIDLSNPAWVGALVLGNINCTFCFGVPASRGTIQAKADTLRDHEKNGHHITNAQAKTGQPSIVSSMFTAMEAQAAELDVTKRAKYRETALVACFIKAGISPYAMEQLLTADFMTLIRALPAPPSRTTIRTSNAPAAVQRVREAITGDLKDVVGVLHADGGSTDLANGCQLIAFMFSSPALDHDVYLGVEPLLDHHERAVDIEAAAKRIAAAYGIDIKRQVAWFCGDNWNGNPAAAARLGVSYAGCAPHGLSLCVTAFLEVMDTELEAVCVPDGADKGIGLMSFFRHVRAAIKIGGSKLHMNELVQWGLSLSKLDIVDTRWVSVLSSALYLRGKQRAYDIGRASRQLQRLAEYGGGGAASPDPDDITAAADDSPPSSVWPILWDFLELMKVTDRDVEGTSAKVKAMFWMCNVNAYATVVAVTEILGSVPQLFTAMQGSAYVEAGDRVVSAVDGLMAKVAEIAKHPEVTVELVTEAVTERLTDAAERLETVDKKPQEKPKVLAAIPARVQEAAAYIRPIIVDACKAFLGKRSHVEKATSRLRQRELFSTHAKPSVFPDMETWRAIGMPADAPAADKASVAEQWGQYVSEWPADAPPTRADPCDPEKRLPPLRRDVYGWWASKASCWPALSKWALRLYAAPVGNARVEGVFSIVTDMGDPDRLCMQLEAFQNELYLRANPAYVDMVTRVAVSLVPRLHIKTSAADSGSRVTGGKRSASTRAEEEAASSAAAAGSGGGASGGAGARSSSGGSGGAAGFSARSLPMDTSQAHE